MKAVEILASLGLFGLLASIAHAEEPPQYPVERCCDICPQTLQDTTYSGDMGEFTKLVKGQDDWLFRTRTDLMTQMGTTPEGYAHLQELRDALKARGVELMVVYIPTRGMANAEMLDPAVRQGYNLDEAKNNYHQVIEKMRSLGIRVPDLTPLLYEHGTAEKPFFFKRDHHWTPNGAEFTASLVADELRKSDVFKNIPRKEFVSRSDGQMYKIGSLNEAFNKVCGYSYANQYVTRFATEPKEESSDLFGDEVTPQVVLAGTSFSSPQYNFAGFLKQHANVDVDNRSVSGGGFHSAMLQYLGSQDFQSNPPKILIWEITSYYDISMPIFYRQIMPMLADGCRMAPAEMSQKIKLRPGKNELLVNADVKPIRSERYIADIQFSQPDIKELQSAFWYMSGSKESLLISRSREVEPDGRFVFRLRDDTEWAGQTLLSMEITMPDDMPAGLEVEAKICSRASANQASLQANVD
ncbi:alginate O-acetyltransferase [Aquipseudomonas ullengensis]|uniref:Alginate biosynthesis protein AlgX n=1 Tax=Aquipseudomonas ullengensis TaxID=2759166 RepID=A0A7W4LN02_9GAMM|nr:alginate O-acetyltransferase [Pseudomonas ullengensis]MBB2496150.1 alginate O-acetyltransferase [Pseudomonas ullengensis]